MVQKMKLRLLNAIKNVDQYTVTVMTTCNGYGGGVGVAEV